MGQPQHLRFGYVEKRADLNATSMLQETKFNLGDIHLREHRDVVERSLPDSYVRDLHGRFDMQHDAVTQTATINLWFGGLIGVRSMTMKRCDGVDERRNRHSL